jgi:F-type H+-transporting ATPase subunit delta
MSDSPGRPGDRSGRGTGSSEVTSAARQRGPADLSQQTRDELYERAQQLDIAGRSSMSKDELVRAIRQADAGSAPATPASGHAPPTPESEPAEGPVAGYAEAIAVVARTEGVQERIEDELFSFARTVAGNAELRDRLTDPGIDLPTKLSVVEGLLAKRAHPQTISAVAWIVQAGRARQLPDIADALIRRGASARNREVAEVRTAYPLDEGQQRRLADALSRASGREVEARVILDPEVVGGVVVKIGDTVIDGSVARRLAELRSRLTGA